MDISEQDVTEMVLNLNKIYTKLKDKAHYLSMTGDALSYTATKIAAQKALLVDVKKVAEIDAKDADTDYKSIKAQAMRRIIGTPVQPDKPDGAKISATAAGELLYGEEDVIAAAKDKAQKEALYNRLKSLVADGHDVIESIRSRLIDLQGSRKDERIG